MPSFLLKGRDALPQFRIDTLTNALAKALPGAAPRRLSIQRAYLVESDALPGSAILARALECLNAAPCDCMPQNAVFTAPRKGTISPWSSRVAEVFNRLGLAAVTRVERVLAFDFTPALTPEQLASVAPLIHDRMTEGVYTRPELDALFDKKPPARGKAYDVPQRGRAAIEEANASLNLALSDDEMDYLAAAYTQANRAPTDTELLMFGQVNSEHCRHKIFNANWVIDGEPQDATLFKMIKHTHAAQPKGTLGAYKDNASVLEGGPAKILEINPATRVYGFHEGAQDMVVKAETHNHPTAISPSPGAATGVGGEIRDEAATGTGANSKAGMSGFIVSHLRVPGWPMPWETAPAALPQRLAPPLAITLEGSSGAAECGNESGRPQINGFFRSCEITAAETRWGFHKPILMAGGMGNIRRGHNAKKTVTPGALVAQLGGPAMRIGLGGGAASSLATNAALQGLDFDSVQRSNPGVQLNAQRVIDACVAMGEANPILSIHDIGAGGLSNACPELIEATGATFRLRDVHNADPSLSPMEIWCCEAQERYVLAIRPESRPLLESLCERERCAIAFIGVARDDQRLALEDAHFNDTPIDMDIRVLLGKPPRMTRSVMRMSNVPQGRS
ncbi:MAG: AIR synthase-related protein, partial [Kiritimatiellaeota bacterium]|nr:AIR synthase-related protein [Kiritimatiellota bacterium]